MTKVDYLVVGSGITGATIARTLADAGREVVVVERRREIGGNVRDTEWKGIRYHLYGPHYFRTNSDRLWDWVQQFGEFYPFEARVKVNVSGVLYDWPLRQGTPEQVRQVIIDGYNIKMWGTKTPPKEVISRIEVRAEDDPDTRLKKDKYQGIPREGYSKWVTTLLKGITVLSDDYLRNRREYEVRRKLIFTGPLDEYFNFSQGKLAYRGQQRQIAFHTYRGEPRLPVVQVNRPDTVGWIREIEWNHLQDKPDWTNGSLSTYETPYTPTNPDAYEYPYNDPKNTAIAETYRRIAATDPKLVMCGRLGSYTYLDMDAAIGRALKVAGRLLEEV